MRARMRGGANSFAITKVNGKAAPSPKPVSGLRSINSSTDVTSTVARLKSPNSVTAVMMIFFRPKMSARKPMQIEPMPVPTAPKLTTVPRSRGPKPHASRSAGPAKASAWVSNPSRNWINRHSTMSRTWNGPNGCVPMISATSTCLAISPWAVFVMCPPQ